MSIDLLLQHFEQIAQAPDAISRMRSFVLDLAVHGRLSERHQREDSALITLTRAQHDRISDPVSGPFTLPDSWVWLRLGDIATFAAGHTPSRNDPSFWNTGDYAWASIADMTHGELLTTTKETVSRKARETVFKADPSPVGTMIMSFKLTIGKIARLAVPAYHNEAIISIHPWVHEMDPYLFLVLPERARQGTTKGAIKGATLNRSSLHELLIPLPPVSEQMRIVAKVNELMALCDQLEHAQQEQERQGDKLRAASLHRLTGAGVGVGSKSDVRFFLNSSSRLITKPQHVGPIRTAILDLAVQGKLNSRDSTSWETTTLGNVGTWGSGGTPSTGNSDYYGGPIPWVVIGDLNEGVVSHTAQTITELGLANSSAKLVEAGTVLIAMYGASVGKMGIAGVRCATNQAIAHCVPYSSLIERDYLFLLLRSLRASLIASAKGGAQPNISQTVLKGWSISLPPLADQRVIVAKVDELMAICDELEYALTTSRHEQGMLLEAVLQGVLIQNSGTAEYT